MNLMSAAHQPTRRNATDFVSWRKPRFVVCGVGLSKTSFCSSAVGLSSFLTINHIIFSSRVLPVDRHGLVCGGHLKNRGLRRPTILP